MRILLVEDNAKLGAGLRKLLERYYSVDLVDNGEDALAAIHASSFDLVILDLGLPDMDGLEVLRRSRDERLASPILILTARDAVDDRVKGLDLGADDYLTKPFDMEELEARVRAMLRRVSMEKTSIMQLGELQLDLRSNTVFGNDNALDISARETMVLRALLMANGRILSKSHLVEAISNFDHDVSENAVEQYVSRLRKKIAAFGVTISAARGLGYHLSEN